MCVPYVSRLSGATWARVLLAATSTHLQNLAVIAATLQLKLTQP
jgi:hypothetical protein